MSNPIAMRTSADLRFDDNNLYLICDMVYLDSSAEIEGFWELDSAYNEDGEQADTQFRAVYINEDWYDEYYQDEFTLYPHVVIGGMLYALYDDDGIPASFRVYLLENGMICTRFTSPNGNLTAYMKKVDMPSDEKDEINDILSQYNDNSEIVGTYSVSAELRQGQGVEPGDPTDVDTIKLFRNHTAFWTCGDNYHVGIWNQEENTITTSWSDYIENRWKVEGNSLIPDGDISPKTNLLPFEE